MADFKDEISPDVVEALGGHLGAAWPAFPRERFRAEATQGLSELALMARVNHVAAALGRCLPDDFPAAATVVRRALTDPLLTGWATLPVGAFVAARGIDEPELALPLLAALTPRFSSEFAIRPFVRRHPGTTFAQLRRWVDDPDEHVRRLVSEGTRPRLPWASRMPELVADPRPGLELLDLLYDDPSEYVRRSVANHLNDVAKDHPELAVATAAQWLGEGRAAGPGVRWVVRHALRTLIKQGHPGALELLGYAPPDAVRLTGFDVAPAEVPVGGEVELRFTLCADRATDVVIDYVVHHAGARGVRGPKVFKLTTRSLPAGRPQTITRRHAFRESSVRRLYPGPQRIDLQVNGVALASTTVVLVPVGGPA